MKLLLTLICLLLGGLIYYQLKHYPQVDVNIDAAVNQRTADNEFAQILQPTNKPLSFYAEIVRRPLFAEDRKPPLEANTAAIESIDIGELESLVLFGVVISGATKYAIVNNSKDDTTEQIKEGHRYKGWRVSAISPDSIQFEGEDAQYELFISPNETTKKSGLRDSSRQPRRSSSSFRSANQKNRSPISVPGVRPPTETYEDFDDELLEELSEEGGYEFDLEGQFNASDDSFE